MSSRDSVHIIWFNSMIVLCGTDNIYAILLDIFHIQYECGKYLGILCGILWIPQKLECGKCME